MKLQYFYKESKGFKNIVNLRYIRFGILKLEKGEEYTILGKNFEIGGIIVSGFCEVEIEDETKKLGRENPFNGKANGFYSSNTNIKIKSLTDCEIGVAKIKCKYKKTYAFITEKDIVKRIVGEKNYKRYVYDVSKCRC